MAHQAGRCTVHGCLGRPWQHGSIGVAPARALVGVHRACWESSSCQAWLCAMSDDQQPCGYMQIQVSRTDLAERERARPLSPEDSPSRRPGREGFHQVQALVERVGQVEEVMSKLSQRKEAAGRRGPHAVL